MIINVGDTIKANHGRTGEIINIGIATEATDIAAENDTALNAKDLPDGATAGAIIGGILGNQNSTASGNVCRKGCTRFRRRKS